MRRAGQVAYSYIGEMRTAYRILIEKPEWKIFLRRPRWEVSIIVDLREMRCGGWNGFNWFRIGSSDGLL
jgi:hypothetical protein